MTVVAPVRSGSLVMNWRERRVAHIRGLMTSETMRRFSAAHVRDWIPRAKLVRYHEVRGVGETGYEVEQEVVASEDAVMRFEAAVAAARRPTLFAYGLDKVEPGLVELRDALGVGCMYRHASYGATLSVPSSGVGFHADIMDVVLIQLEGTRRWRVWTPDALSDERRRHLCRGNPDLVGGTRREGIEQAPALECELRPGDALCLPALWPHEGLTLGNEVSTCLAFGWFAITPHVVLSLIGHLREGLDDEFWLTPIPDPDGDDIVAHYAQWLAPRVDWIEPKLLADRIQLLLMRRPWRGHSSEVTA